MDNRSGIEKNSKQMRVEKKRYSPHNAYESASIGRPRVVQWISIASLELIVEVAEVVQGVEDELPL